YFLTSESLDYPKANPRRHESALNCDKLENHFAETSGAQVLLLDVARPNGPKDPPAGAVKDRVAEWPKDSPVGVFRAAWLGGGQTPPEAQLLSVWANALVEAGPAPNLVEKMAAAYAGLREKYTGNVLFNWHLPAEAATMLGGVVNGQRAQRP